MSTFWVLVAFLVVMLGRRRWLARRPGVFRGAARLVEGEAEGFRRRWRSGYGRWAQDVFVRTPAPLVLRSAPVPVDAVSATRPLGPEEVRRPRHPASATRLTGPGRCSKSPCVSRMSRRRAGGRSRIRPGRRAHPATTSDHGARRRTRESPRVTRGE
ncbi:hypothetical protein GCM10010275_53410 [Streptomyces litmocidini]|nr:hypothetical protein GCM10010275_53410 [Streptomyces litmocidini]